MQWRSYEALLPRSCECPTISPAIETMDGAVHRKGEQADDRDVEEDLRDVKIAARNADPVAKPCIGGDQFRRDEVNPGGTDEQPDIVEKARLGKPPEDDPDE